MADFPEIGGAWCTYRSPVGLLRLVASAEGMQTLKWLSSSEEPEKETTSPNVSQEIGSSSVHRESDDKSAAGGEWRASAGVVAWGPSEPASEEQRRALENVGTSVRWLDAYFDGSLLTADPPVAKPPLVIPSEGTFSHCVWHTLASTGIGETLSYSQLARLSGNPKAARATGSAVRRHGLPILIPCHRVVRSGGGGEGSVGNYSGGEGAKTKKWLLEHERKMVGAARATHT